MKKLFLVLVTFVVFTPSMSFTMEEKPASNTRILEGEAEAEDLWWNTAMPLKKYGKESLPYAQYRENMLKALSLGIKTVQHHYHNPLVMTVPARDLELTQLFLDRGASPTFRGMNMISGFDALRIKSDETIDNPASIKQLESLLEEHRTEERTPYPMAGVNGMYMTDREFEKLRAQEEKTLD